MNNIIVYALVFKNNGIANFKGFISFEELKQFVKDNFEGCNETNLKPVDKGLTIFYLEKDKSE